MAQEKIHLTDLMMVDPGCCSPGTAMLQSHYHVRGGFQLAYSPDSGLVHITKVVDGKPRTRSVHISRVREMEVMSAEDRKVAQEKVPT